MEKGGLILALDQGTHASRAILFDSRGEPQEEALVKISLKRISDTHVEQDPLEVYGSLERVLREVVGALGGGALAGGGAASGGIVAAGMATQRSSVVAWRPSTMEPLAPMLSWLDRRVEEELGEAHAIAPRIKQKTGLPVSPHYGAGKIRWLLKNNPQVERALKENDLSIGPLSSYLVARLTKNNLVDHANASRTLLWNLSTKNWDPELLELFGVPQEILPTPVPIVYDYGSLLDTSIPLRAVTGDQNGAVFAYGLPKEGEAIVNLGSGAFLLQPVGEEPPVHERLLCGLILSSPQQEIYALEGTVNGCALALDWASEKIFQKFGKRVEAAKIDSWFGEVEDPPIFINTVGGLGSPFWRGGPEAAWLGEPASMEEAAAGVLESILFLLNINLEAVERAGHRVKSLRLSGGLSNISSLCQRMADLSGLPVTRPPESEATARGAAFLAASFAGSRGAQMGGWSLPAKGGGERSFTPHPSPPLMERYRRFQEAIIQDTVN